MKWVLFSQVVRERRGTSMSLPIDSARLDNSMMLDLIFGHVQICARMVVDIGEVVYSEFQLELIAVKDFEIWRFAKR